MPSNQGELTFRVATPADAASLLAIYAPYVEKTAVTFEYDVPTVEEFARRIASTLQTYPYLVAELDGTPCGYAYAGPLHAREAYSHTVETSIYLDGYITQLGVGTLLYTALENVLLAQNVYSVNACIASPACENDPYLTTGSQQFHAKRGYRLVGCFRGCGYKFGRWYDMIWMEKLQGGHAQVLREFAAAGEPTGAEVPAFIPFACLDSARVRKLLAAALKGESEDARRTQDSAGAVVFRQMNGKLYALMITMKQTRHSFPKGHIEAGETKEQAALREIAEETGVQARIIPGFCYSVPSARKTDHRSVHFLLGEYVEGELEYQREEIDVACWVPAEEAATRASFPADKAMYEAALAAYLAECKKGEPSLSERFEI